MSDLSYTEMRIYGLFAKDSTELTAKTPKRLIHECEKLSTEKVATINKKDLTRLLNLGISTSVNTKVQVFGDDRGFHEYFGDHYQIIAAVCLHTDTHVLLLKLNRAPEHIDSYTVGSLTYPQGHVDYDADLTRTATIRDWYTLHALINKIKTEALRELGEEICHPDTFVNKEIFKDITLRLMNINPMRDVYPIYINHPGTTGRHICMLLDVDMSQTSFVDSADQLVSNEPEKHSVLWASYSDLLKVERADSICPWVADSFSKLSFYQTTFLKDYLKPSF